MKNQSIKIKKGPKLWREAKKIIPGGGQLLSKRSEMFLPDLWPSYYKKAKGVEIFDLDGNKYIDMERMSVGAAILGYADLDVNRAVKRAIDNGSIATLNCPEEVELSKLLIKIHPWANMVRYTRSGGEAMAVALRIARASSGRDRVAFCGYHGWSDWYLASNLADNKNLDGHLLPGLSPRGVPRGLKGTAIPFEFNNVEQLEDIVKEGEIGVIVVEPLRHQEPTNNFLQKIRAIADRINAVLVFDEISIGWRMTVGGVHLSYKVNPDIVVFAKAMSNGYPIGAIVGTKKVMEAAQDTFISSTYWTERVGFVASIATINKLIGNKVPKHLDRIGKIFMEGLSKLSVKHELKMTVLGPPPLIGYSFDYDDKSREIKTLYVQEMLKRGFLVNSSFYPSYAHKEKHIISFLKNADDVFAIISKAIESNNVTKLLEGPIAHDGFRRLT